jgi:hypothetical protein
MTEVMVWIAIALTPATTVLIRLLSIFILMETFVHITNAELIIYILSF